MISTGVVTTVTTMLDHATPSVTAVSDHPTRAVTNVFLMRNSVRRALVSV